jgi:UDP-N-acetylmuramate--alanine ligase
VLTNLDEEHLDQYETVEEIKKTFANFANKVPFYCPVILCLDDSNLQSLIPQLDRKIVTYGFSAHADVFARNLQFHEFTSQSTLFWKGKKIGKLRLNVPGIHSIQNAMAAVAVGLYLDIPAAVILEALEKYTGIGRRFELKKKVKNIFIIEDYAHHPTEIKATLDAAKQGWTCRTFAIFQPHRYSRLSFLMDEFATSFNQADILLLTDIYPAGEKPIKGVTGKALYKEIQEIGHKNVHFEKDLEKIPDLVEKMAQSKDMIFVLGAGNINKIIPEIIKRLERRK